MKQFRVAFLLLLLCCLRPGALQAAQYVVAHDATWPPFEFFDKNNTVVGYSVDYITAVGKEAGFSVVNIHIPWDGIFTRLNSGEFQIVASSVSITEERKKVIDFSAPYFETEQQLLLLQENAASSTADLQNAMLGAQTGTSGQSAINSHKGLTAVVFDDVAEAAAALVRGKLTGVVCDREVARHLLASPQYKNKLKLAPFPISQKKEYYGFAVRKGDKELTAKLNEGIAAVKKKHIDKDIYTKWFGEGKPVH